MGTQGTGRKRSTKKDRSTAEDDALNLIAREAEARLAAKRAARAEAREIRMKELERQQKEIFQVQKKYYGLNPKVDDRSDSKWGDIEQWMEDSERYSRSSRIQTQSDEDERMSVGSRGSVRSDLDTVGAYGGGGSSLHKKSKKKKKHKHKDRDRNGCDDDHSVVSGRSSRLSDESRVSRSSRLDLTSSRLSDDSRLSRASRLDLQPTSYASSDLYSLNGLSSSRNPGSAFNGYQSSLYDDGVCSGTRRVSSAHPLDYSSYRSSGSRASSRASSARASPVDNHGSVASFLRSAASSSGLPRDLDDVTIPDFSDVEDRDYLEKGSRAASALTAATLTSLGGSSSRRGSGETALTVDAETSIREIKEIHELKDQIQDVESKYSQNLKEVKDALAQSEEKYRKAMVSNAQLDNEKNNLMYHVDTLKDSLMELEELLAESRRDFQEKVKDYEREKHAHGVLQFQFNDMKETLKQSEELLNDIRQLRLKQEGFLREISDLQETVEWKDKKIGALERQKEYTDAIRVERDELREEVVTLKDILKKHGIVLGPDLNVNGDAGEAEIDGSDAAAGAPRPPQEPPLGGATEGNSMLGNTEETEFRRSGKEDVDPQQQQQEILEEAKENLLNCDGADDEKHRPNTPGVADDDTRKDLTLEAIVESKAVIVSRPEPPEDVLDSEKSLPEAVVSEEGSDKTACPDRERTEIKSSAETQDSEITETSDSLAEKRDEKRENSEGAGLVYKDTSHRQTVACVTRESPVDESVTSNAESRPEAENADEAGKDAAEETPSNSNKGKKRRKKKRGKKKAATHNDAQNQQSGGAEKGSGESVKRVESGEVINGCGEESLADAPANEDLEESTVTPVKNEQDERQGGNEVPVEEPEPDSQQKSVTDCDGEQKEEGTETLEEVEAAPTGETLVDASDEPKTDTKETQRLGEVEAAPTGETLIDASDEPKTDTKETQRLEEVEAAPTGETLVDASDEPKTDTKETRVVESVEAAELADGCPRVETHQELGADSRDDELRWETDKVESVDLEASGLRSQSGGSLTEEATACDDADPVPTDSKTVDQVEDKSEPVEATAECSADRSSLERSGEENAGLESLVLNRDGASALGPTSVEISSPSTADALRRPSECDVNPSVDVLDGSPREGTETVDDEAPGAEEERASSPRRDSEAERQEPGREEPDRGAAEPSPPATKQPAASEAETAARPEPLEGDTEQQTDETSSELRPDDDDAPDGRQEAGRTEVGSSITADGEDPERRDESEGPRQSVVEESPPTRLESDGEDDEDEGQSFDFDDLDVEAAVAPELPHNPEAEEFEEGVEVTLDEGGDGKSGSCQSDTQPDGKTRDEPIEETDGPEHEVSEEADPEPKEETAIQEPGGAEGGRSELGAIVENLKDKVSSLVEEALDVVKLDWPSDAPALPKSPDQDLPPPPPQAGRGGRKGGKKGKGKEDCKVS